MWEHTGLPFVFVLEFYYTFMLKYVQFGLFLLLEATGLLLEVVQKIKPALKPI